MNPERKHPKDKLKCRFRTNHSPNQKKFPKNLVDSKDEDVEILHTKPKQIHHNYSHLDNYNPIRGYLKKNVGRKWDDVYSELVEMYGKYRKELEDIFLFFVYTNVEIINGNIYAKDKYSPFRIYSMSGPNRESFYVDPDTGILKLAPEEQRRVYKKELQNGYLTPSTDPLVDYLYMNGVWYQILYREMSSEDVLGEGSFEEQKNDYKYRLRTHVLPRDITQPMAFNTYPRLWDWVRRLGYRVPIQKRQLSTKEIKTLNLTLE